MKSTDSVMREKWEVRFDKEFGVPKKYEPKLHSDFALLNRTSEESACEMTKESIKMAQSDNMIELYNRTKDFIRHSLADARREWVEETMKVVDRHAAWKPTVGFGSDEEKGFQKGLIAEANLLKKDLTDLLTGDNPKDTKG